MCVFPKMSSNTSKSARLNFFLQVGWNILQKLIHCDKKHNLGKNSLSFSSKFEQPPGKSAEFIDEF